MAEYVNVTTQKQLDKAVAEGNIPVCRDGFFSAYGSATVRASGSATVRASDSVTVRASGSATVRAYGSATVRASDSATVEAYGSATVRASDSVTVRASGSATVEAYGSVTVEASGSATVEAYGSATVRASDSVTVRASGSATVRASGSVTVRAYGSATVRASPFVGVHRHGSTPKVKGGVLIQVPDCDTPEEWCAYYGIKISRGFAIVFKGVSDEYLSNYGTSYKAGEKPVAPDFKDHRECGEGLHFSPRAFMTRTYTDGPRFMACKVKVADMVIVRSHGGPSDKCKAPACTVLYECDEDGQKLALEGKS